MTTTNRRSEQYGFASAAPLVHGREYAEFAVRQHYRDVAARVLAEKGVRLGEMRFVEPGSCCGSHPVRPGWLGWVADAIVNVADYYEQQDAA